MKTRWLWLVVGAFLSLSTGCIRAEDGLTWKSDLLNAKLEVKVTKPQAASPTTAPANGYPVVVFLKGLTAFTQAALDLSKAELLAGGCVVAEIDYGKPEHLNPNGMAREILKLRSDLTDKKSSWALMPEKVDPAHVFILPAGYRLKRDVEFARSDKRVLAMDIAYPAESNAKPPMLLEFSCDNKDRMGSTSLLFCKDTLLETGALNGFIVAMADHPVAPPFKGIDDPMPETLEFARSAIKKIRSLSDELGGNGKVGVIGFSRGATFAAMLAAEGTVDRALVHGNRFDYTRLRPDDKMAARFAKAWGPLETSREKWELHGAFHYLTDKCAPMYLNTSDKESPEYRDGLEQLHVKLTEMKVPHEYAVDNDGRGHQVSQDPARLEAIFKFFDELKK